MKLLIPLLITTLFSAGCIEKSTPNPVNQGKTDPFKRPGEWESSGIDDPPVSAPEESFIHPKGEEEDNGFGVICFADKETAEKSSGFLNNDSFLKEKPHSLHTIESYTDIISPDHEYKLWSEVKGVEDSSLIITKVLARLAETEKELSDVINQNLSLISLIPSYIEVKENEEKPLLTLQPNCLYTKFTQRLHISHSEDDNFFESNISDFIFTKLSSVDQASLILHEALYLSTLNSNFDGIYDVKYTVKAILADEL